jgi:hypothetical protein
MPRTGSVNALKLRKSVVLRRASAQIRSGL